MKQFVQEVCCPNRAIKIANSIKNLWLETYENTLEQEYAVSFGSDNGYVIYNFTTTIPSQIFYILKEIKWNGNS